MKARVEQLLEVSKQVILDCSLENGSIVAANTDKSYYPKFVNNYRFVWPRDVSFTIYAASLLGIEDIEEKFVNWLLERAEGFKEEGFIYQRYATNGTRDLYFGSQYQPDQAGALLWILTKRSKSDKSYKKAITLLADGLCSIWNKNHFNRITFDLWEERKCIPSLNGNFAYTLSACSYGLDQANKKHPKSKWKTTSRQMKKLLKSFGEDYYYRLDGKLPDKRIDASVFGLIWPFNILRKDKRLGNSIAKLEKSLLTKKGVRRYEHDEYDGQIGDLIHWKKGAGAWPLLNFWHVKALDKIGERKKAKILFKKYLRQIKGDYIPEQIFDNDIQHSVSPLCWSHSMFVIAAKCLGY